MAVTSTKQDPLQIYQKCFDDFQNYIKKLNLSQRQIARLTGTHQSVISNLLGRKYVPSRMIELMGKLMVKLKNIREEERYRIVMGSRKRRPRENLPEDVRCRLFVIGKRCNFQPDLEKLKQFAAKNDLDYQKLRKWFCSYRHRRNKKRQQIVKPGVEFKKL